MSQPGAWRKLILSMSEPSSQNSILRVSAYLLRYRWLFGLTLALAVGSTAFLMAIPNVIEWVFDVFLSAGKTESIWIGMAILMGCFFGRELFNSLRIRVNNTLEQKVLVDLRSDLHAKLLDLPVSFYDRRKSGEIASRVVEDVDAVERALLDGTEQGLVAILTILGFTIMLFLKDPFLASFVCLPLPVLLALGITHAKATRKNWRAVREAAGELNSLLIEDIQGNRMIHSFALRGRERGRFMERAQHLRACMLKAMYRWAIYGPSSNFINSLGMVAVVGVGGYKSVVDPNFDTGDLSMFFFSTMFLYEPIARLHQINHLVSAGKSSGDRVFEVLDHPLDVSSPDKPTPFPEGLPEVLYQGVSFRYHERANVLREFSLTLPAGKTTALVGHTGAGKSTVANLLMRYYDVSEGVVTINGTDVRTLDLEALRGHIGYVAQEPFLFEGTVRDNLMLARPDASESSLIAALEGACAWDFVKALPQQLDTNIGEKGIRLSQGEKQRLTIARVLLKNPKLVIFDEATASVDTLTEALIQQALDNLTKERTVLVIAHRLSTVRNAHQIVVLNQGSILELGTHEELIHQRGHYAELWRRQADLVPENP